MSAIADKLVSTLLEDDFDAHVKAHQRVQNFDKAHSTFRELLGLKQKSMNVFRELGTALGYERALAHVGLTRDDVDHVIRGEHIGATHNYKGTEPGTKCTNRYCSPFGKYTTREANPGTCGSCGEPLENTIVRITPARLRGHYARHILGVATTDNRYVWFNEPVPPQPAV